MYSLTQEFVVQSKWLMFVFLQYLLSSAFPMTIFCSWYILLVAKELHNRRSRDCAPWDGYHEFLCPTVPNSLIPSVSGKWIIEYEIYGIQIFGPGVILVTCGWVWVGMGGVHLTSLF